MSDQCRVGESMADDYFQHAADCPECEAYEAARVAIRGPREPQPQQIATKAPQPPLPTHIEIQRRAMEWLKLADTGMVRIAPFERTNQTVFLVSDMLAALNDVRGAEQDKREQAVRAAFRAGQASVRVWAAAPPAVETCHYVHIVEGWRCGRPVKHQCPSCGERDGRHGAWCRA